MNQVKLAVAAGLMVAVATAGATVTPTLAPLVKVGVPDAPPPAPVAKSATSDLVAKVGVPAPQTVQGDQATLPTSA